MYYNITSNPSDSTITPPASQQVCEGKGEQHGGGWALRWILALRHHPPARCSSIANDEGIFPS